MTRTKWDREIEKLNNSKSGVRRIEMSGDGVAQVTRVRLLERYSGVKIRTERNVLVLELEAA